MDAATLKAALDRFTGASAKPQPGCVFVPVDWGNAETIIEVEFQPAEGDGWNEPRHEASVAVIGVLLNGEWCDPEAVAPEDVIEQWTKAAERHEAEAVQCYWESVAEARAEDRMAA